MVLNNLNRNGPITVIKQLAFNLINEIERGTYKKNDRLLSINNFSKQYGVARDTIERAYQQLITQGYIIAIPGKGYFVRGVPDKRIKVLFILNTMDVSQKKVYESTLGAVGNKAKVDIAFYHNNLNRLNEIVETNLNKYNYFIVSPYFSDQAIEKKVMEILEKIPSEKLIFLEKKIFGINYHSAIIQDFKMDIYCALQSIKAILNNYRKIILIIPIGQCFPEGIDEGVKQFCCEHHKEFGMISSLNKMIEKGTVFITLADQVLVEIIKACKKINYEIGKEIGIISYDDTPLKELLDITVMHTDFASMGKAAADIVLKNKPSQLKNRFNLILRSSL